MFKLDRKAFKAHTAEEATAMHSAYYRILTWQQRLEIADYLNSVAYSYVGSHPPKMDKSKFSARARK